MRRLHKDEQVHEQARLDLDEIARQGARRMLAEALEAEVQDYLDAAREQREGRIVPWSSVTVTPQSEKCYAEQVPSKSGLRGSTTNVWTKTATSRDSRA